MSEYEQLATPAPCGYGRPFHAKVIPELRFVDPSYSRFALPPLGCNQCAEAIYGGFIIAGKLWAGPITDRGLLNYAFTKRVIPVSPNSFYAYLQTILLGLKGMHVEEQAQEILKSLARLSGDFEKFRADFELVGKHLTNTKSKYDDADKRLEKFGDRLQSLSVAETHPVVEETTKLPL